MEAQNRPPPATSSPPPRPTHAAAGAGIDSAHLLPHFIRAEANLLRLPLFALHTKGLKTLDGIECRGRMARDGQTHQFTFRATRNTATLYPGPLARAAHLAFLSLLTEKGLPIDNPITWHWRDLCRRMRISAGGQMLRRLKQAIQATALLGIQSEYALYAKDDGQLIHAHQDLLHLYERVTFVGSPLPNGARADTNYLWLSDWYLANLNALHSAPLDYDLWRHLDERSSIASRLYEFLIVNFYSGTPVLRINYETLAQFLPVHRERYRSLAQRQFDEALTLLRAANVLEAAVWCDSKAGLGQIHLYRGQCIAAAGDRQADLLSFVDEDSPIEVKELRNLKPPEWTLVADFYRLWTGTDTCRPTPKELVQARALIAQAGPAKAKALMPLVVKRLKERWPEAKTFAAVTKYLPDAAEEFDRKQRRDDRRRAEAAAEQQERGQEARTAQARAALKHEWERLPSAEQARLRQNVLARQPRALAQYPGIVERLCLEELGRQRSSTPSP